MKKLFLLLCPIVVLLFSCKKEEMKTYNLVFKFRFDSTQERLTNIGQPSTIPAGNAAQNPVFNTMSAHYLELAPGPLTLLGQGVVLYRANETTVGGSNAIDFQQAKFAGNNQVFFSVPLSQVSPGSYEWLRLSLAYQNYDVKYRVDTSINGIAINQDLTGTVASFIGFNQYIKTTRIKNSDLTVNANKKQGFWAFETSLNVAGNTYPYTTSGQTPDGGTTVVNPLFATSPVPQGSCVVTGQFQPGKLVISGKESQDIVVEVSLSTNKSFEWKDRVPNNKWEPMKGEEVVDMGIRGMKLKWQ